MIIDWKVDPDHAARYDILDADTYRDLSEAYSIWHADDARGLFRHYPYTLNDRGQRIYSCRRVGPGQVEVVSEEVRARIRIVPKRGDARCRS